MKKAVLCILIFLFAKSVTAQTERDLHDSIPIFFNEIKAATSNNIRLWNKDLYGAMLLVNPQTRQLFANEADSAGVLKSEGTFYSGMLPFAINIANTAIDWNGKRWAMIQLPLPNNEWDRTNLLAHELFHKAQPSLGFISPDAENNHLDQRGGRIYLRLELEALKKAIQSASKKELRYHLGNALIFRTYRHELYPGSDTTENGLELNEGLAEFTGAIMSGRNNEQATEHFINNINFFLTNPSFVRSFAYYTIPVYGYLLYQENKNWNKAITTKTNLTNYFIKAFGVAIPADVKTAAERVSDSYNGNVIFDEEARREENLKKLIAKYKYTFVEQPHLEIPLEKMNISFNPGTLVPLEDKGTVYPHLRVSDRWGVLTVDSGALMSPNWDKISIANPVKVDGKKAVGEGWILELNEGYEVERDEFTGRYKITKH